MSTVLNTAAKVKAEFGGTTWTQISGKFLLAANSTYAAKSTGGSSTHKHTTSGHTLTTSEIPAHTHGKATLQGGFKSRTYAGADFLSGRYGIVTKGTDGDASGSSPAGASYKLNQTLIDASHTHTSVGGGGSHTHGDTGSTSTFPSYYAVYIWERTA